MDTVTTTDGEISDQSFLMRKVRVKLDLTQEEFGHLIGLTKQTVYRCENRRTGISLPVVRLLQLLDRGLVSVSALEGLRIRP